MPIIGKQSLRDDLLISFPDNDQRLITPKFLRDYLENFVDSNLSLQLQIVNSSPTATNALVDLVGFSAGAGVHELPDITSQKDRLLYLINDSGGTVTVNRKGTDTIQGGTSIVINDNSLVILVRRPSTTDWNVVLNTGDIEFGDLTNVNLTFPQTGDFISFDGSEFVNIIPELNDLVDVDTTTTPPVLNDTLVFDGTKFVPAVGAVSQLDDLTDVNLTTVPPVLDHYLHFDGTEWIGKFILLDELADVDTTTAPPSVGDQLEWDGTNWVPVTPTAGALSSFEANATAQTTSTSTTDVLVNSMTLTPGAGDYIAWFSSSWECNDTNEIMFVSIYVNGSKVNSSERRYFIEDSIPNTAVPVATHDRIMGLGAGQPVEIRWRVDNSGTMKMYQRKLVLLKIG